MKRFLFCVIFFLLSLGNNLCQAQQKDFLYDVLANPKLRIGELIVYGDYTHNKIVLREPNFYMGNNKIINAFKDITGKEFNNANFMEIYNKIQNCYYILLDILHNYSLSEIKANLREYSPNNIWATNNRVLLRKTMIVPLMYNK